MVTCTMASTNRKPEFSGWQRKQDIQSIKTDVDELKTSLKKMTVTLDLIHHTMRELKADMAEVKEALSYAPGGPGYDKAKTHFDKLIDQ